MSTPFFWIRREPWGIHIAPADAWVDPARAVDRALKTHGHSDHARGEYGENWITHGREHDLLRRCELNQRGARALALVERKLVQD